MFLSIFRLLSLAVSVVVAIARHRFRQVGFGGGGGGGGQKPRGRGAENPGSAFQMFLGGSRGNDGGHAGRGGKAIAAEGKTRIVTAEDSPAGETRSGPPLQVRNTRRNLRPSNKNNSKFGRGFVLPVESLRNASWLWVFPPSLIVTLNPSIATGKGGLRVSSHYCVQLHAGGDIRLYPPIKIKLSRFHEK